MDSINNIRLVRVSFRWFQGPYRHRVCAVVGQSVYDLTFYGHFLVSTAIPTESARVSCHSIDIFRPSRRAIDEYIRHTWAIRIDTHTHTHIAWHGARWPGLRCDNQMLMFYLTLGVNEKRLTHSNYVWIMQAYTRGCVTQHANAVCLVSHHHPNPYFIFQFRSAFGFHRRRHSPKPSDMWPDDKTGSCHGNRARLAEILRSTCVPIKLGFWCNKLIFCQPLSMRGFVSPQPHILNAIRIYSGLDFRELFYGCHLVFASLAGVWIFN